MVSSNRVIAIFWGFEVKDLYQDLTVVVSGHGRAFWRSGMQACSSDNACKQIQFGGLTSAR